MALPATPSFRLDGRRALVTGAGRGIGLALAAALADAGAAVTLAARSADEIEAGAEAIRRRGGTADAAALDQAMAFELDHQRLDDGGGTADGEQGRARHEGRQEPKDRHYCPHG